MKGWGENRATYSRVAAVMPLFGVKERREGRDERGSKRSNNAA